MASVVITRAEHYRLLVAFLRIVHKANGSFVYLILSLLVHWNVPYSKICRLNEHGRESCQLHLCSLYN